MNIAEWGRLWVHSRRVGFFVILALVFQPARGVADHGLDLVLAVLVLAAVRMPLTQAILWGMMAGFFQDLSSVMWVGPHLIGNALAAGVSSWLRNRIYRERIMTQGLMVVGACLLQQAMVWMLLVWDGTAPQGTDGIVMMARTVAATSLFGFMASYILVRFGRRYHDPATA